MSPAGEIDLAGEWRRSDPDIAVYLPGGDHDTDNEHFLGE
jgi:hypothetical protein